MSSLLSGPFLFDTSAESYLEKSSGEPERRWLEAYLKLFPVHVSVITVLERARGYAIALERAEPSRRDAIEAAEVQYLQGLERNVLVWPLTLEAALIAARLMALCPLPPSPPRRSHRGVESRAERLSRWRFHVMIAATALAASLPLVHNNAEDFEFLRGRIERAAERFPGIGPLDLFSVRRVAS